MTRWLVLGGLAVGIWLALEVIVSRLHSRLRGEPALPALGILARLLFGAGRQASSAPPAKTAGRLVRCASCGQHVPEQRALRAVPAQPAAWFCSPECQRSAGAGAR